jgi:hypothetical protein
MLSKHRKNNPTIEDVKTITAQVIKDELDSRDKELHAQKQFEQDKVIIDEFFVKNKELLVTDKEVSQKFQSFFKEDGWVITPKNLNYALKLSLSDKQLELGKLEERTRQQQTNSLASISKVGGSSSFGIDASGKNDLIKSIFSGGMSRGI